MEEDNNRLILRFTNPAVAAITGIVKKAKMEQILWTIPLVIHLFQSIQQKGGHLTNKTNSTATWDAIRIIFFQDAKASLWNKDPINKDSRKLREKMKQVIEATQKDMGWGDFYGGKTSNLSGREGDQSIVNGLVKQFLMEILALIKMKN